MTGLDKSALSCPNCRMTNPDLAGAYALNSADDCRQLYAEWADSYDADWATSMDYRLPAEVAAAFLSAGPPPGAVLDVGAGTGLLAAALRGFKFDAAIDGVDLSADMLAIARQKGLYRDLIEADITHPLPGAARYAGLVSSGTFTHGHVGPHALIPLLQSAQTGALFTLSINAQVYETMGFSGALAGMSGQIYNLQKRDVAIYGAAAASRDAIHARDRAYIISFRAT